MTKNRSSITKNRPTAKEEEEAITKMSNQDLLEETIDLAAGDDYDGCFTNRGAWRFGLLKDELSVRLIASGFIEKELQ